MRAPFLISLFDTNLTLGVTVGSGSHGEMTMRRRDDLHPRHFSLFFICLSCSHPLRSALLPLDGAPHSQVALFSPHWTSVSLDQSTGSHCFCYSPTETNLAYL